jgi:hypothetical protein
MAPMSHNNSPTGARDGARIGGGQCGCKGDTWGQRGGVEDDAVGDDSAQFGDDVA